MPTSRRHFEIASLLKQHPRLALTLLQRALDRAALPVTFVRRMSPIPTVHRAAAADAEVTSATVAERFADGVLVFYDAFDTAVLALDIEVQLDQDEAKYWRWPDYLVGTRTKHACPTEMLVVCVDAATAKWAAEPIPLGLGTSHVAPLVVTPADFPGRWPGATIKESLLMAALAYAGHPNDEDALHALVKAYAAIRAKNEGEAAVYADLVASLVQGEPLRRLEDTMLKTEGIVWESEIGRRSWAEGEAKGRAEGEALGEAKGRAETLLRILRHRGIAVPDDAQERILSCSDSAILDSWIDRALDAHSITDVLA
jgi:hypothetical protein